MPDQIQVVATINIGLTPEGRLLVQAQGQNLLILGMLEQAKHDLQAEWSKPPGPKIEVAPPGMSSLLSGRR